VSPNLGQRTRAARGFERIYRRHVGDVYHYALAVMRNQADAEDVTQTTFLNAFRAFERGERPQKPQNWLIAIAHNVCRQRFRQTARRPQEVSFDEDIGDRLIGAPEEEAAPSADDIRRALGHLAFNQRAALVMRELEGRSYADIGEILELSPSAVETVLFRARRALREQLESSLTCGQAELAISRQLDGRLPRRERGALRAHLRECPECATFARRQRAQRSALKSIAAVPLPASLTSLFGGGGGAVVGTGVALKAGAAVATGIVLGGGAYVGVQHATRHGQPATSPPARHVSHPQSRPVSAVPPSSHRTKAKVTASAKPPAHARSRAHARAGRAYHGDASVAARHAHLRPAKPSHPSHPSHPPHPSHASHPAHRPRPSHPAHPVHPLRPHAPRAVAPTRKPALPPGPYIGGPPAAQDNAGNGHGKDK
jgi:RNA polymerase sigma-70 factor (ECF subfamily)